MGMGKMKEKSPFSLNKLKEEIVHINERVKQLNRKANKEEEIEK